MAGGRAVAVGMVRLTDGERSTSFPRISRISGSEIIRFIRVIRVIRGSILPSRPWRLGGSPLPFSSLSTVSLFIPFPRPARAPGLIEVGLPLVPDSFIRAFRVIRGSILPSRPWRLGGSSFPFTSISTVSLFLPFPRPARAPGLIDAGLPFPIARRFRRRSLSSRAMSVGLLFRCRRRLSMGRRRPSSG